MFKSLVILRLPSTAFIDQINQLVEEQGLSAAFAEAAAEPPSAAARVSAGLYAPAPHWPSSLVYPIPGAGGAVLMAYRQYERVIPKQAVHDALVKRITEVEEKDERSVTARERRQILEQIVGEMLPQSFIQHKTMRFIVDGDYAYFDNSANKPIEEACAHVRAVLGSFPARRILTENDVLTDMRKYLVLQGDEEDFVALEFQLGTSAHMRSHEGEYRVKDVDLASDATTHELLVEQGATVHRLDLVLEDTVQFVIDGDLTFRSIKTLDRYEESRESIEDENDDVHILRYDADLLLSLATMRQMRSAVTSIFGGERDPEAADHSGEFANAGQDANTDDTTEAFDL